MKTLVIYIMITILQVMTANAQSFYVKSTSIPDKKTNVPLSNQFAIRFSEPIDITKQADWNEHNGASPVPFVNLIFKSKNQNEQPVLSFQINDSATVLTLNLQLQSESAYELRIWGGRSLSLVDLDYFSIGITTASIFPTGKINGLVTSDFSVENDYLILLPSEVSLFNTDLDVLIDAYRMAAIAPNGSFTFTDVEDGSYQVILIGNRVGDPFFDYTEGDDIGVYDQDKNGIPDAVLISGGGIVSGLELSFFINSPSPTEINQNLAAQYALNWAADSRLWNVQSFRLVDSVGVSDSWGYTYFSQSSGKMLSVMFSGTNLLLAIEDMMPIARKKEFEGLFPVWKGSAEVAAVIWKEVKTRPYYKTGFPPKMSMALLPFMSDYGGMEKRFLEGSFNRLTKKNFELNQIAIPEIVSESDLIKPVWYSEVYSTDRKCKSGPGKVEEFLVSGFTSHILNFNMASASVSFTELDMELNWKEAKEEIVAIFSMDLSDTGTSEWGQITYDKLKFVYKAYFSIGNVIIPISMNYPIQVPGILVKPIRGNWLDSPVAVELADGEMLIGNPNMIGRNLTLMHETQFFPKDTSLYWYATYYDYFDREPSHLSIEQRVNSKVTELLNYQIALNARTGEVRKDSIIHVRTRLDEAISEAKKWSPNADLFNIEAVGLKNQKGTTAWVYDFKRPLINDYLRIFVSATDLLTVPVNIPVGIKTENESLTTDFIGDDSVNVVQSIYNEIDFPVSAVGLFAYNGQPVWVLKPDFESYDFNKREGPPVLVEDEFFIYLDGKTGRLIDSLDMLFNEKAGIRAAFGNIAGLMIGKSLKVIRAENIDSTGLARVWRYIWSLETGGVMMVLTHGNMEVPVLEENLESEMVQYVSSIPELKPGWMGSEETAAALMNWMQTNPINKNIDRVSATLLTGEFPEYTFPTDPETEYWFIEFREEESEWDTIVVIKALTGEIYTEVSQVESKIMPFSLEQNYPNPFNPETMIRFTMPEQERVKLTLYSVTGQKIGILLDETRRAGTHQIRFRADHLASGVYLYKIDAGTYSETRKMILIK
ncbi:MAG: T9SS type A sorting domain-containing protein [Bacteroidetes bacterium]|nr:T9SS type A sorting domain-containing protein [Bacteroidota bacterium]